MNNLEIITTIPKITLTTFNPIANNAIALTGSLQKNSFKLILKFLAGYKTLYLFSAEQERLCSADRDYENYIYIHKKKIEARSEEM